MELTWIGEGRDQFNLAIAYKKESKSRRED